MTRDKKKLDELSREELLDLLKNLKTSSQEAEEAIDGYARTPEPGPAVFCAVCKGQLVEDRVPTGGDPDLIGPGSRPTGTAVVGRHCPKCGIMYHLSYEG